MAGWAALEIGDLPAARAHLEAAIRAAETIRDPSPVSTQNLGWVLRAEHDLDGAWSRFGEALRTSRLIGSKRYMAGTINGLACLATDLDDWRRAAVLHGAAQAGPAGLRRRHGAQPQPGHRPALTRRPSGT